MSVIGAVTWTAVCCTMAAVALWMYATARRLCRENGALRAEMRRTRTELDDMRDEAVRGELERAYQKGWQDGRKGVQM